jgi:hypothetical protein
MASIVFPAAAECESTTLPVADGVFPFGAPVAKRPPSASSHRALFIMGAYPSALHVRWVLPGVAVVQAMPVDNEPVPFWDGADQAERVELWKTTVHFDARLGRVEPAGDLNGSSGTWVAANVLAPLRVARSDAWVTDVLDTYRCSTGVARRVHDTYDSRAVPLGAPPVSLLPHPSESEIVREGLARHRQRLLKELAEADPERIVTLGNASLRVMRELLSDRGGLAAPEKLSADDGYGRPVIVKLNGRNVEWFPLAHPAARGNWQVVHRRWAAEKAQAR